MSVVDEIGGVANVVSGVGALTLVVSIHELGHFAAAVSQGIRIKEFSVGFGPRLALLTPPNASFEVSIRALPLGGFVAFPRAPSPGMLSALDEKRRREERDKRAQRRAGASAGERTFLPWARGGAPKTPPPATEPSLFKRAAAAFFRQPSDRVQSAGEGLRRRGGPFPPPRSERQKGVVLPEGVDDVDPADPDLLDNRPLVEQAIVIGAGVCANVALSWVLLTAAIGVFGETHYLYSSDVVVSKVLPHSPADVGGMRKGDRLLAVSGEAVPSAENGFDEAVDMMRRAAGAQQSVDVRVLRPVDQGAVEKESGAVAPRERPGAPARGARGSMPVTLTLPTNNGPRLGVEVARPVLGVERVKFSDPIAVVAKGTESTVRIGGNIGSSLGRLASSGLERVASGGKVPAPAGLQLEGPLGIANTAVRLAKGDPELFLIFIATVRVPL